MPEKVKKVQKLESALLSHDDFFSNTPGGRILYYQSSFCLQSGQQTVTCVKALTNPTDYVKADIQLNRLQETMREAMDGNRRNSFMVCFCPFFPCLLLLSVSLPVQVWITGWQMFPHDWSMMSSGAGASNAVFVFQQRPSIHVRTVHQCFLVTLKNISG